MRVEPMGKKINLVGKKFGRLTVMTESPYRNSRDPQARWLCVCDCGKTTEVSGGNLRSGKTKSCGCTRYEPLKRRNLALFRNLTGQTFGRLTAIGFAGRKDGNARWRCLCSCGRETVVDQQNLLDKRSPTRSCGCYRRELTSLR
jgi:hypothetical protein